MAVSIFINIETEIMRYRFANFKDERLSKFSTMPVTGQGVFKHEERASWFSPKLESVKGGNFYFKM